METTLLALQQEVDDVRLLGGRLPWELLRSLVVPFLSLLIGLITNYISRLISASGLFKTITMTEPRNSLLPFTKHWGFVGRHKVFPDDVLPLVFAFLVDAQSICNIQRTCRATRRWNYHNLQVWKLDWVYKNLEDVLGVEKTIQLRDGLLTEINLLCNGVGVEGAKVIGEALKVNTSLTTINLNGNKIGDEGGKAIGEALKVNTSLTEILLQRNNIGDEGAKAIGEALKVNTSLTELFLQKINIGAEGGKAIEEALKVNTSLTKIYFTKE